MQQAQISHEMCVTIGKAGLCHSCTLQWGTLSQVSGLLDSVTASYTSLPESALAPMQARSLLPSAEVFLPSAASGVFTTHIL